jgi:hypothetical protein
MKQSIAAVFLAGMIAAVSGCAAPQTPACTPALGHAMVVFSLYFGRSIPARRDLTEQEWQAFLDDTVTANLPNGYTVFDAAGAWMNPMTRKTIREASKVIVVAMPDVPDSLAAINRIRTAYQLEFQQQLVGMTAAPACGSF